MIDSINEVIPFFMHVLKSYSVLLIILDPFLGAAVFLDLTKGMKKEMRAREATIAASVALGLLITFLFSGAFIFNILGITIPSFKVGGGIILFLLGAHSVLGFEFKKEHKGEKISSVIIGTPLLCGPGTLTTILMLSNLYGVWAPLIASILAITTIWIILYYSDIIEKIIGKRMIQVFSKVFGLVLVALAIEFVKNGIFEMIK